MVSKTKDQLMDELDGMRRRVAELEGSASKDGTKEDEKHIRDLAFLSRTATGFLELSPEDNIYEFIAEQLKKLGGNSIIMVNSFDEATDCACCREVLGVGEKMGAIVSILGKHPVGMFLKIDNEARLGLTSRKLVKVPGGFYEFCFRRIPRTVCHAIEKVLDLGDIYAMGFAWKGKLFGSASILTHKGTQLADQTVIETFIYQASVALQQRRAEQALREARDELEIGVEERTRELAEANAQLRGEVVERKRAEETLRESESKYRAVFETTGMATVIIEEDTTISLANAEFEKLSGYSKEEIESKKSWTEFVAKGDLERMKEHHRLRRIDPDAAPKKYEFQFIDKKGDVKDVFLSVNVISGTKKSVASLLDITERKRAKEQLWESEERYRELADFLPETVFEFDERGNFTFSNRHGFQTFGYTLEDFDKGLNTLQMLVPEDRDRAKENIQRVLSGEELGGNEYTALSKDGSTFPVIIYSAPIIQENKPVGLRGFVIDITERKQVEEKVRKTAEEWSATFNSITDFVSICDKDFRIVRVNKAFADLLKKKPDELIDKHCYEVFHGANEPLPNCPQKKTIKTKKLARVEFLEPHLGIHLEVATSPIFNDKGDVVASVHIARDITERKQAEEKLLVYQQELRSLASELSLAEERERRRIAMEVHDHVSQNLVICCMKLGSLVEAARSTRFAKPLNEIQTLIKRLIDEVRTLTFEVSSPLLYELGLEAAVERLTEQMGEEHGVKFNFEDDGQPKPLDNDIRVLLFQAVRELLINITKHAQARYARVHMERHDGDLRITVLDDGVGFDTSQISPGSKKIKGFGFFSIRERLHQIGGHIEVKSKRGRGTRVTLTIPLKQE